MYHISNFITNYALQTREVLEEDFLTDGQPNIPNPQALSPIDKKIMQSAFNKENISSKNDDEWSVNERVAIDPYYVKLLEVVENEDASEIVVLMASAMIALQRAKKAGLGIKGKKFSGSLRKILLFISDSRNPAFKKAATQRLFELSEAFLGKNYRTYFIPTEQTECFVSLFNSCLSLELSNQKKLPLKERTNNKNVLKASDLLFAPLSVKGLNQAQETSPEGDPASFEIRGSLLGKRKFREILQNY